MKELSEILEITQKNTNFWLQLWNLFIVVSIAIVTVLLTGNIDKATNLLVKCILTAVYLLFVASNFSALLTNNQQNVAIYNFVVNHRSSSDEEILSIVRITKPVSTGLVGCVYFTFVAIVILVIWLVPRSASLLFAQG